MTLSEDDVHKIVIRVVDNDLNTQYVANQFGISRRRVQQLAKEYRRTKQIPKLRKRGRPPRADYPVDLEERVIRAKKKLRICAVGIGHYLRKRYGIHVGNDLIHGILAEKGLTQENPNMRKDTKAWIRYERAQSLSAVHMDWHQVNDDEWVCFVEDDSSRKILSGGEFDRRSADASVELLQKVLDESPPCPPLGGIDGGYEVYGHIRRVQQVITDHGSEFYANKRDKDGNADHRFEIFCKENGIQQILCRYNHPQSNGKIEKWFDTYQKHRSDFETLEDFLLWYNKVRPHMSLDYKNLETPRNKRSGKGFEVTV
jgi:putative transposase